MTKSLGEALEIVRQMPPSLQDAVADMIMRNVGSVETPEPIEPEHLAAVLEGLGEADRREFATDEEVAAAWRRFDG